MDPVSQVAVEKAIEWSLRQAFEIRWRFLGCAIYRRNADLRVSFSAFLRLSAGNKYLLIRNLHRPETFGPIGGVYKHFPEADSLLHRLEYRPQAFTNEMLEDLRGFVPRHRVSGFLKWFRAGSHRETHVECLSRELDEELAEIEAAADVQRPVKTRFTLVRRVTEGPEWVDGENYYQFRHMEVYEMPSAESDWRRFVVSLIDRSRNDPSLLAASAEEIARGRSADGRFIGHHSAYLFQTKRIRRNEPGIVTAVPSLPR